MFNFDFLCCAWEAPALREVIDATLDSHARVGATPTWVLSNHDVVGTSPATAGPSTAFSMSDRRIGVPSDLRLGTRRARAAALLTFSLPGGVYLYQGDELGLPEVEDLPDELLQDPIWERSRHTDRGRDGCRVPLPWSGEHAPVRLRAGRAAVAWLPQPADWKDLTAEAQSGDPGSMLELYRRALRLRRAEAALADSHPDLASLTRRCAQLPPGRRADGGRKPLRPPGGTPPAQRTADRQRGAPRRPPPPGHRRLAPGLKHAE